MKKEYVDIIAKTLFGLAATGVFGVITFYLKTAIKQLKETPKLLAETTKQLEKITGMNVTQLQVQRLNIKAMRSFSYALKEVGCNGSVDKAMEHINKEEDLLNKQEADNLKMDSA